jgi:glutathione synthase
MTNKIVAIQGNKISKLKLATDTSIFLANEIQKKNIEYFIIIQKIYL